ncbi:MAG: chloride channel protein, partial [Planctomycetes bacterium]|nr:chloride channel protein [Planctomycetota bacterium]
MVWYCVLIGILGAVASLIFNGMVNITSYIFLNLFADYSSPGLPSEGQKTIEYIGGSGRWLIPVATTFGAFLSGWLVYRFAPETEGAGTGAVIQAYHHNGGKIRARVPIVKAIASALTIGSGGAAGRQGPMAQISAGLASIIASSQKFS